MRLPVSSNTSGKRWAAWYTELSGMPEFCAISGTFWGRLVATRYQYRARALGVSLRRVTLYCGRVSAVLH